ncbi:MAG TPA: hypothetical protein DEO64_08225 [Alcaligenes faecalis]|nr:hypothetical protein [Alcaligenes faecalis]
MLLAMDFTGKEALPWKLAYITAFSRMEVELRSTSHKSRRRCLKPFFLATRDACFAIYNGNSEVLEGCLL